MANVVRLGEDSGKIGEGLMPRKRDMVIYQGDDFSINVAFGTSTQARLNMTGWVGHCSFKKNYDAPSSIDATVTIRGDGLGLTVSLPDEITSTMFGKYLYDLELVNLEGKRKTYMYGEAEVIPEITKVG